MMIACLGTIARRDIATMSSISDSRSVTSVNMCVSWKSCNPNAPYVTHTTHTCASSRAGYIPRSCSRPCWRRRFPTSPWSPDPRHLPRQPPSPLPLRLRQPSSQLQRGGCVRPQAPAQVVPRRQSYPHPIQQSPAATNTTHCSATDHVTRVRRADSTYLGASSPCTGRGCSGSGGPGTLARRAMTTPPHLSEKEAHVATASHVRCAATK